jgi:23S rRNA (guanine745-N1)-methyltransferase
MMQARRAFLDAGHYLPLRETVAQMLNDILPASPPPCSISAVGKGTTPHGLRGCS